MSIDFNLDLYDITNIKANINNTEIYGPNIGNKIIIIIIIYVAIVIGLFEMASKNPARRINNFRILK